MAKEDVRAGSFISVQGKIRAGRRIFAGLVEDRRVTGKHLTIECSSLTGKVAYGEVVYHAA